MNRLLIVAPDTDFRKSLQFALEAEGYQVELEPRTSARAVSAGICTVVDHHAIDLDLDKSIRFFRDFWPVVLLANTNDHALAPYAYRTLMKPLLGQALTAAVRDAVALRSATK